METINETPYLVLPFDCSPTPQVPAMSLIVKGSFRLCADASAEPLAAAAQKPFLGDDIYLDDLGRSLRYASDLVPLKVRGEVLVDAVCHQPDGRPRTTCVVSLELGPIRKTLHVSGDRSFVRHGAGPESLGPTQPFEHMPIRWERAFGGLSNAQNPLGLGLDVVPDESGQPVHALPNVEYPDGRMTHADHSPRPAGFGPVAPQWQPRLGRQGTRDQRWAMFRAPLVPKDFDLRFHNAAPDDQQLEEGYFRGDETLVLGNLHARYPELRAPLPGSRPRAFFLVRQPGGEPARFVEVELRLDTVHVDVEREELVLVWRRPVKIASRAHPELEALYLTEEPLAGEPRPVEVHHARFAELRGPKEPPLAAALDAEIDKQMVEARKVLTEAKVDPEFVARLEGMKEPRQVFDALIDLAEHKIRELEQMTAALKVPR